VRCKEPLTRLCTCRWEAYNPNKKWDTYSTGASGVVRDSKGNEKVDGKFMSKIN
jgi:hypothetical protein